jgi:hypothetical protein
MRGLVFSAIIVLPIAIRYALYKCFFYNALDRPEQIIEKSSIAKNLLLVIPTLGLTGLIAAIQCETIMHRSHGKESKKQKFVRGLTYISVVYHFLAFWLTPDIFLLIEIAKQQGF